MPRPCRHFATSLRCSPSTATSFHGWALQAEGASRAREHTLFYEFFGNLASVKGAAALPVKIEGFDILNVHVSFPIDDFSEDRRKIRARDRARVFGYFLTLARDAFAFSTTFSTVKPNSLKSCAAGPLAPNVDMPMISPLSPAYLYQL